MRRDESRTYVDYKVVLEAIILNIGRGKES